MALLAYDTIPAPDADAVLRHVRTIEGHTLLMWDAGRRSDGKDGIGYAFTPSGRTSPIFVGTDIGASPMHANDSNETVRSVLWWLTLRLGDTDADFFADYTPDQTDWSRSSACEMLACDLTCLEENPDEVASVWMDVVLS